MVSGDSVTFNAKAGDYLSIVAYSNTGIQLMKINGTALRTNNNYLNNSFLGLRSIDGQNAAAIWEFLQANSYTITTTITGWILHP